MQMIAENRTSAGQSEFRLKCIYAVVSDKAYRKTMLWCEVVKLYHLACKISINTLVENIRFVK